MVSSSAHRRAAAADHPFSLEVPIVIESERDFQSRDAGLGASGDAWVEMPLVTERTLPMKAAVRSLLNG